MKRTNGECNSIRGTVSVVCAVSLLVFTAGLPAFAQQAPPPYPAPPANGQQVPPPASQPLLTPEQLENVVAPIALYPDPMLGQVLAASTYPLEVVEAEQWMQQNGNLRGADLMNAARQQNWDPSIQALVAFPDVLATLNRDVRWTTDLGNAFLAQQQDVMAAVQRLRVRAQQNGRLSSNPQQTVTTQDQNGQSAVVIEPANPQVIYVPVYNPDYVWGPSAGGYYPPLWYPPVGYGFGFGPGIYLNAFFPGWLGFGWGGWGLGWGWGCGWFGGGLFVNTGFFNHFGFHGFYGGRFGGGIGGRLAWEHDAFHRGGVAYANRGVADRFNNSRFAAGRFDRGGFSGSRSVAGSSARTFNGGSSFASRGAAPSSRGAAQAGGGWQRFGGSGSANARGFAQPNGGGQAYRGNAGSGFGGGARTYAAPRSNSYGGGFNGNARSYSGGGFSGSARSFSGGGSSGGRSFGGGGGGHSFGGGGGHAGGGHGGGHR